MLSIKHSVVVLLTAAGTLAAADIGASAKVIAPAQPCSALCISSLSSPLPVGVVPRSEDFETDADYANAKNPALPPYARGRGQETGGPARELISN
ncbi:hypothetical protein [Methylobacterium sp. R2-1]|uniref:hypothetical protein n=1 Tax=Methylobacterium sp. R2-1 TaxID=2587064 RepID=UPI00161B3561|nr:hypothetical protein [Methylobacterium sp. R2-1]MBB2960877.1 hypothetical protein [Methylobacterium sp. R2-1]